MKVYIALLRGINVGGHHIVKMAELRAMFESLGLAQVQTYIQSGNVLFVSDEEESALIARIEAAFEAAFGFAVTIMLRTADALRRVIADCPFPEHEVRAAEEASGGEVLYIAFMNEEPPAERVALLKAYENEREECRPAGRELYLIFRHGMRNAKLADHIAKLRVPVTMRNRKTVAKLIAMADAIEGCQRA